MAYPFITLGLLVLVVASYWLWGILTSPLNKIPGPLAARFTKLWRLIDVSKSQSDLTELELHRRYGPYVRIGPNLVSIADSSMIPVIYSTKRPLAKSDFYRAADNVANGHREPSVFSVRPEDIHTALARPIQAGFSLSRMLQFEGRIDASLDHLMTRLRSGASSARPFPLGAMLHRFAWDVSGELNFSKRFGAIDGDPRALNLIEEVSKAMSYLAIIGQMPILDRILKNPVLPISAPGFGYAIEFAVNSLSDRVKNRKYTEQRDFVDLFIDAENDTTCGGSGAQFTSRQISWLASNVIAASDSTGAAIQSAVYFIARNKDIKARLVKELTAAFGSNDEAERVPWKVCHSLPFLHATIKETFRLEPGVGMPLERVVSSAGMPLPSGVMLPAGTVVGMNARVLNHDESVYGPDAHEFKPDRWLRGPDETREEYSTRLARFKQADLTFGRGSRGCLGKPIALLEAYKCVARLFLEFDVELARPDEELRVSNRWFMNVAGVDAYLRKRSLVGDKAE